MISKNRLISYMKARQSELEGVARGSMVERNPKIFNMDELQGRIKELKLLIRIAEGTSEPTAMD